MLGIWIKNGCEKPVMIGTKGGFLDHRNGYKLEGAIHPSFSY